jgi:hypothetical protein
VIDSEYCARALPVPPEYFSHIDMSGRRVDFDQRPELSRGTVDFRVTGDYWALDPPNPETPEPKARKPEPLSYVFAIDVSWTSAKGGVVREVAQGLKEVLFGRETEGGERIGGVPQKAKVAILTFDRTVHFYNLQVSRWVCTQVRIQRVLIVSRGSPNWIKHKCSSSATLTTCSCPSAEGSWWMLGSRGSSMLRSSHRSLGLKVKH